VLTVARLQRGRLLDLNVTVHGYSHAYPNDVDLLLVAPNGRSAVILSDVGVKYRANNLTIVLDDQASLPLPSSAPLALGSFRPGNQAQAGEPADLFPLFSSGTLSHTALSTFSGINPNGTWQLRVVDDVVAGLGSIAGWPLTIKSRVRV
jgi:subtilisin-like proprotein convertase family protein